MSIIFDIMFRDGLLLRHLEENGLRLCGTCVCTSSCSREWHHMMCMPSLVCRGRGDAA
jgi:hypothetical protein